MKKKLYSIVCLWSFIIILLCACGKQPDQEIHEPDPVLGDITEMPDSAEASDAVIFQATVTEVFDNSILVKPVDGSLELSSSDQVSIPNKEQLNVQIDDLLEITYNGEILESYPVQLGKVYKIVLIEEAEADGMWDRIPMVRVNGKLYFDTGRESTISRRCGTMDGEITTSVDGTEIPMEDDQSNFGDGFGYQYGADDTIEIYMNEKWIVFEQREESE